MLNFRLWRQTCEWPLETGAGRLRLRPMKMPDLRTVQRWFEDHEVLRFAFGADVGEDELERMGKLYFQEMDASRHCILAIDNLTGSLVGFVRYSLSRNFLRARTARVGILLGERQHWGQGHGTEAMTTFVKYLFEKKSVDVIELDTADFNVRAQRCFERCGFVRREPPEDREWRRPPGDPTPKVWMELKKPRKKG